MISGPYAIRVIRLEGGWYVQEFADGSDPTEWGPYRWRWLASLVKIMVSDA